MNYRFQLSISAVSSLVFVLLLNCSYASHQVAPGYELGWANYEIDTKVAKFPGKIPGKGVGRFYKINDFLNRASARERTGIYITEPYDPDKIPVLFVHGLICDPYAWEKMTKRLSRDPVIRENYQFWYYAYPSATPVIGSAAIFKLHLDTYIDALKEEHGHSLDRRVVIIGHSTVIGGVFSRVVLDSNHEVHKLPETSQIVNLILKHNIGLIDNKELRVQSKTIKRLQALDD